ncbi:hypothetical protein [Candidatus Nitrotoga sp. BS]|uniref:hypothetical protein n=1 Tax=Candidatus Nitrotoga sp. BS TaxID=2890408 RepID=UPI001EF39617|nr:hypothetical protein [Candidatus Nitrotoga sp. BS]
MNTTFSSQSHFDQPYQTPLKHLKLKGLQPKTIEVYSLTLRRIGARSRAYLRCQEQQGSLRSAASCDAPAPVPFLANASQPGVAVP